MGNHQFSKVNHIYNIFLMSDNILECKISKKNIKCFKILNFIIKTYFFKTKKTFIGSVTLPNLKALCFQTRSFYLTIMS